MFWGIAFKHPLPEPRGFERRKAPSAASGARGVEQFPKLFRCYPCLRGPSSSQSFLAFSRCSWQLQFSLAVLACRSPEVLRAAVTAELYVQRSGGLGTKVNSGGSLSPPLSSPQGSSDVPGTVRRGAESADADHSDDPQEEGTGAPVEHRRDRAIQQRGECEQD